MSVVTTIHIHVRMCVFAMLICALCTGKYIERIYENWTLVLVSLCNEQTVMLELIFDWTA